MGFKPASTIKGRVFVPDETAPTAKKHPCPDCFQCQMCGEERCRVCRPAACQSETQDTVQTCGRARLSVKAFPADGRHGTPREMRRCKGGLPEKSRKRMDGGD
jgi:hypothetical protein